MYGRCTSPRTYLPRAENDAVQLPYNSPSAPRKPPRPTPETPYNTPPIVEKFAISGKSKKPAISGFFIDGIRRNVLCSTTLRGNPEARLSKARTGEAVSRGLLEQPPRERLSSQVVATARGGNRASTLGARAARGYGKGTDGNPRVS